MKRTFASRYQSALLSHLNPASKGKKRTARGWGQQALAAGLATLDMAKLHEKTLVTKVLPSIPAKKRAALIKRAGIFFSEAFAPADNTNLGRDAAIHLNKIVGMLSQRTVELAASNVALQLEIVQRTAVEAALKKSEHHYTHLLHQSDRLQQQLRLLSREILSAQEEERKEISRELHDVIAQTLTGINVRLAALAKTAVTNTDGLEANIAETQRLVEKSVDIVHRFARDLRPAVLDDLGLIPALHSFLKNFTTRTGIRSHITASAGVELLDIGKRTVLFRVAQEALTNVARHARASRVDVTIAKLAGGVSMKIKDNGKSFVVERALHSHTGKRLGLLGMRERVEMVGGVFSVQSSPGHGTLIQVEIPHAMARKRSLKSRGRETPLESL